MTDVRFQPFLFLFSCDPDGSAIRRILVQRGEAHFVTGPGAGPKRDGSW